MLELIKMLIAFKYSCKIKHWNASNYSQHLLFDRLQKGLDDIIDGLAEKVFMSSDYQNMLNKDILSSDMISDNLYDLIDLIINVTQDLVNNNIKMEGVQSLLGNISEDFLQKKGLIKLEFNKNGKNN